MSLEWINASIVIESSSEVLNSTPENVQLLKPYTPSKKSNALNIAEIEPWVWKNAFGLCNDIHERYRNDKLLRKLNILKMDVAKTHNGHALECMFVVNWILQQEQETSVELIRNKCIIYA